jgi:molybdopterin-containing oxidoreductase family iron-sulfur binding subunit
MKDPEDEKGRGKVDASRRGFLKSAATVGLGTLSGAPALAEAFDLDAFLQDNFRELSDEEIEQVLERLSRRYSEKYGKTVTVDATGPIDGVLYGYGLDISRCIGCRRCVYGCVEENNQSRDPQIHWIRVLEFEREAAIRGINLEEGNPYYDHEQVPAEGKFYIPIACQHCEDSPCATVCPTGATWREPDGIVVIDYDWCIGCRYCMASCPYGAEGGRREVQLLHPARAQGPLSGVRGGLPGGGAQVRQPARSGQRDPIPDGAQADLRAEIRARDQAEVLLLLRVSRTHLPAGAERRERRWRP